MMDKMKEKEALKSLLMALANQEDEEEEPGAYVEERRETSVSPEEVEGELYDEEEGISEDAEAEEEGEMSLKDLVAAFMNEKADPFAEKKAMPMGGRSLEIEIESGGGMDEPSPLSTVAKKVMKKKRRR
jgi:hypothetical protein